MNRSSSCEGVWMCQLMVRLCLVMQGGPLALVSLHVQSQVIGAGEAAAAHAALERLHPRVFPEMASQLVGSGETPLTAVPRAAVRLLSCVGPGVGLQVRGLGVDLLTPWDLTVVDPPSL